MVSAKVSIILLVHDEKSARELEESLPSILKQTYPIHEILLIDNCSKNVSLDFVKDKFPNIKLVRSSENLGYAGGNNEGFKRASGELIAVLNPDVLVDRDWLRELVKPFQVDEKLGLATSKILLFNEREKVNACGNIVHFTGLTFCRGLGRNQKHLEQPQKVAAVSGCSFLIRKKVLEQIGGFDSDFFFYLEDTDLSLRARLAGYEVLFVPTSLVFHKYSLNLLPWKYFYLERNRYLILAKYYRKKELLLILPALFLTEVITWGYACIKGRDYTKSKVKVYTWVLSNFKKILQKRRESQKLRLIPDKGLWRVFCWYIPFEQIIDMRMAYVLRKTVNRLFYLLYRFAFSL